MVSLYIGEKSKGTARGMGTGCRAAAQGREQLPMSRAAQISTPTHRGMDSVIAYEMFCHLASTYQQADEKKKA